MSRLHQSETRLSLLIRLTKAGPHDEGAWGEFVEHYTPLIYRWCLARNLQETDAKDVTQQVLLKLATILPTFSYDPNKSFHSWLKTVTVHTWADFVTEREPRGSGDSAIMRALASVEARDDLLKRIDLEFDLEMLETAMNQVRARVEPATWDAFRLTALEGIPAGEAAKRLGKKIATIYVSRSNVQRMLKEVVVELESTGNSQLTNA